jgi:hypothetical protein
MKPPRPPEEIAARHVSSNVKQSELGLDSVRTQCALQDVKTSCSAHER